MMKYRTYFLLKLRRNGSVRFCFEYFLGPQQRIALLFTLGIRLFHFVENDSQFFLKLQDFENLLLLKYSDRKPPLLLPWPYGRFGARRFHTCPASGN